MRCVSFYFSCCYQRVNKRMFPSSIILIISSSHEHFPIKRVREEWKRVRKQWITCESKFSLLFFLLLPLLSPLRMERNMFSQISDTAHSPLPPVNCRNNIMRQKIWHREFTCANGVLFYYDHSTIFDVRLNSLFTEKKHIYIVCVCFWFLR